MKSPWVGPQDLLDAVNPEELWPAVPSATDILVGPAGTIRDWGLSQFSWVWHPVKQPLPARAFPQGEFLLGWGILGPFNFYAGEEYGRARTRGRCHASTQGLTWGGL